MDQNNQYNNPMVEEEEGLDIMALVRSLWDGRKTILIVTGIFIVLGLVAAITMKRTYTVSTTMVPQMSSSRSSSLARIHHHGAPDELFQELIPGIPGIPGGYGPWHDPDL